MKQDKRNLATLSVGMVIVLVLAYVAFGGEVGTPFTTGTNTVIESAPGENGAPSYEPLMDSNSVVRATWVRIVTKTNLVLVAKDTFPAVWPMMTTTNLVTGTWTNEAVPILIEIGPHQQKFFKPVAVND